MRSKLFIGSSTEGLSVAYALQANMERAFEVTVWTQGVFELSKALLESLMGILASFDFAVFVFTPDDILMLRGEEYTVARDNVVFELGLFLGRLGRERTYFIAPRNSAELHLPGDLAGIGYATYDSERQDKNLRAALGPACQTIVETAERLEKDGEPTTPTHSSERRHQLEETILSIAAGRKYVRTFHLEKDFGMHIIEAEFHLQELLDAGLLEKSDASSACRLTYPGKAYVIKHGLIPRDNNGAGSPS